MNDEHVLKQILPFAECRYSKNSGRHYKSHMHKTFSVGAIDKGEVIYEVEEKTAVLRPGSLALINPETLHSCNPKGEKTRSYYVLYLDVDWCLQLQQSLWQIETFNPVDIILLENSSIFQQFITAMDSVKEKGDYLEKEQMLAEILEKIFLLACKPGKTKIELPARIEELKEQLSTDLEKDISLQEVALILSLNPYTMLRQFKSATGITPHVYRLNCRIELAKKLLQQGFDLSRVALECGFFDQSHFHRHFKAITTITPKEYQVNFVQ